LSIRLPVTRFSALADLTDRERAALRGLAEPPAYYPRGSVIRAEGQQPHLYLLHTGWAASSATFADGKRQFFKVHLPGDVMGAPSLPLQSAAETLTVLTDATVSRMSLGALGHLFADHPRVGALFFLAANEERVILMDRLIAIGRRAAVPRLAALLLHLDERLSLIDGDRPNILELPLTQEQIGDLIGLTPVHVNRVFRRLEAQGVIERQGRTVVIPSHEALSQVAAIPRRSVARNPAWLPAAR
jgi:CRP/FNR family transcriptional regulator, anaerobic regulatory protein